MPLPTLREFFRSTYLPLRLRGGSADTLRQYAVQFKHLERFLGREPLLSDLDDLTIARFLEALGVGRAIPTVNKARCHLLAVWRLAAERRLVPDFPNVQAQVEPWRAPRAWLEHEITALFSATRTERGMIAGIPAARWWNALLHVSWYTAERIGAVMAVRWEWVDLETGWLTIPAEARKGKRRDRAYRLNDQTLGLLLIIRKPARELVFPWPRHRGTLYNHYSKILARAGLPTDRKSKFHRIRKSAASHFKARGGDAQKLLDHSSSKTTEVYIDSRICPDAQGIDLLFDPQNS